MGILFAGSKHNPPLVSTTLTRTLTRSDKDVRETEERGDCRRPGSFGDSSEKLCWDQGPKSLCGDQCWDQGPKNVCGDQGPKNLCWDQGPKNLCGDQGRRQTRGNTGYKRVNWWEQSKTIGKEE